MTKPLPEALPDPELARLGTVKLSAESIRHSEDENGGVGDVLRINREHLPDFIKERTKRRDALVTEVQHINVEIVTAMTLLQVGSGPKP